MPVTDSQVAALRAYLTEDRAEHERLMAELDAAQAKTGYFQLLMFAFGEAARHHFRGKKSGDIVEWVADVRARWGPNDPLDPNVAERLILWVFGKASTDGIDFETELFHQGILLLLLLDEQRLDNAGVDAFLHQAREVADAAMSGQGE